MTARAKPKPMRLKMVPIPGYIVVDRDGRARGGFKHLHSSARSIARQINGIAGPGYARIARVEIREITPPPKPKRSGREEGRK